MRGSQPFDLSPHVLDVASVPLKGAATTMLLSTTQVPVALTRRRGLTHARPLRENGCHLCLKRGWRGGEEELMKSLEGRGCMHLVFRP